MASEVFAERLKRAREASGMSAYALAKASGLSKQSLSTLESGASQPSWETVQKLAKALGVGCDVFTDSAIEVPPRGEPTTRGRPRKPLAAESPATPPSPPAEKPAKKGRGKKGGTE